MSQDHTLVMLSGGGTGGSVAPLLAIADGLRERAVPVAWIGTHNGLEKAMVTEAGIDYHGISAGKLRRYFSLKNFIDPFKIFVGFFQALSLLSRLKPAVVMTAGAFVSVPVVWAAWSLRIKVIVHQQDLRPGLANRLMAPLADVVTVTFEKSVNDYGVKAIWTGNPVRNEFEGVADVKSEKNKKHILILGGGSGAQALNLLTAESISALTAHCTITHVTGKDALTPVVHSPSYTSFSFVDVTTMAQEMSRADLVITRAGLGTLTELSFLGKPTLIIPMPDSHQEDNAEYFAQHEAAVVLSQKNLSSALFVKTVALLLDDEKKRNDLSEHIKALMKKGSKEAIIRVIEKLR